ncbi:hypothetical protein G3480_23380 [Thiorhodococcus mannitoliphagus]|uniref:Uncharacterized protein n=1 Tax=Thiorhodococcus mannitoliphagus TaxID=329406 RepID=A0A6P1E5A4_9GAMM|nr:hypothetical protein [Thiorhodococcus mannitoliphagus]NEX23204.1 hypothetical protein [Thiorhodococcus mannitoliphagus]
MGASNTSVSLPKETVIQLQALSLPGESLVSVIQRAALALHTLESSTRPETTPSLTERMDALESRIERIEQGGVIGQ